MFYFLLIWQNTDTVKVLPEICKYTKLATIRLQKMKQKNSCSREFIQILFRHYLFDYHLNTSI